jgi:tripeptide aminopeptidase
MNAIQERLADSQVVDRVLPRFLTYVRYWTTSDRHLAATPSSEGQWELARALQMELRSLGIADIELTDHCYLIARIPATSGRENAPPIGLLAHLDTSSDVSGKDVKPLVTKDYDGKPIALTEGRTLDPEENDTLSDHIGDTIITSDGTTLLGADDKAGLAEIMGAVDYLLSHPELPHGPLEIVFTPDEETGKGLPEFPLERIRSIACYTMDGGPAGELEAECFTAYKADVEFTGKVIHVGYARGKLANAALMAATFAAMLPRSESPESTDGYYGYYGLTEIKGDMEKASIELLLRDFEQEGMERRIASLEAFARATEAQFPGGKIEVKTQLQYLNMKRKIAVQPRVVELLRRAAETVGVEPYLKPIRGGTDGSRLTELGIPTPNVFAGGRNFHSRTEWIPLSDMVAATRTIIELVRLWSDETVVG